MAARGRLYRIPARVTGYALRVLERAIGDALRCAEESRHVGNEWLADSADGGELVVTIEYRSSRSVARSVTGASASRRSEDAAGVRLSEATDTSFGIIPKGP